MRDYIITGIHIRLLLYYKNFTIKENKGKIVEYI